VASAELILHTKRIDDDGAILELKLWWLPQPVPASIHRFKYSLYYGRAGERLVGYDNERGKGDHRHYGGREQDYDFISLDQLLADFEADVETMRGAYR
jgi:hypothetical protein